MDTQAFTGLTLADMGHLAPELTLVAFTLALILLDLFLPRKMSRTVIGWLSLLGVAVSAGFVIYNLDPANTVSLLGGAYRIDDFANILKLIFLVGTALILLMSFGSTEEEEIHQTGEYYYLLLPATMGAMFMASSSDLITLYVGLETLSIASYVLVGMRKRNLLSSEGAFKYAVQGGIASAFILYGMSFLYGMTGSTNITAIRQGIAQLDPSMEAMLYMSFFLLLAGFGFKIAAAPFHTWAPDVYQGAPTPISAFLATVSKGAGFAVMFRLFYGIYLQSDSSGAPLNIQKDAFLALCVVAAAAMIVGNVLALKQSNMKRLLAYSGIANAGYLLVPLAAKFSLVHYSNFAEFSYYLTAYMLMNIGAFAVLMVVKKASGTEDVRGYAGLFYRAPWTTFAMVILVLSLAGFPVTGGFFGKIFILMGTLENKIYWLASIMLATSVLSFYYYFGVIRQMFMRSEAQQTEVKPAKALIVTIWICALASVAMGAYPQGLLRFVNEVFNLLEVF
ncbi:NADH-quinone oxidoreductase subunit N [Gorillibacterium massiliense]|uniref:NADH-quinone oxidoreductase subunit N n=1 Tax=Gorillibacterium massiliense TaxID=1280390 RepID=UPI0004AD42FF|nr:NADH-quinone oxidoreductase subunit N [Gorillibacterium massiliense]